MKISHHWLQQAYFTESLPSPEEIKEVLGMRIFEFEGSEIHGSDTVLEFDVLPNRAHDCLSHRGIAREIKVLFNRTDFSEQDLIIEKLKTDTRVISPSEKIFTCSIENPDLCRRHVGRVIENIQVAESPVWLQDLLKSVGQRSINNVVDATNYVMLALGQPTHVFDLDKFAGGTLFIRSAQEGEVVTTLDKREVKLIAGDLVLADSEGALDIAGIKGGIKAELTHQTKNILLSVANFDPAQIRKTARRTGVLTDASKRFENEITPELCNEALEMLTALILDLASTPDTRMSDSVDVYPNPVTMHAIALTLTEINNVLGTDLDNATVSQIFQKFGFAYTEEHALFTVHIPAYRLDLVIKEDIIEEIGRVYGYDKIINKSTDEIFYEPAINNHVAVQEKVRGFLLSRGFSEVMTYSFVNTGEVQVLHPVASDKSYLRTNLHEGVSESLEKNAYYAPLLGLDEIKTFEIGSVFVNNQEKISLCIALDPLVPKKRTQGVESILESVLSDLEKELSIKKLDVTHKGLLVLEVNLTPAISEYIHTDDHAYDDIKNAEFSRAHFTSLSQFPFMVRDIAVWLPVTTDAGVLLALIHEHAGTLLTGEVRLVDCFPKGERISYAYRLVFQSHEKTLSDEEVNSIMEEIYSSCRQQGFETR